MNRNDVCQSLEHAYLLAFAIYEHPKDYPNHFVVRHWRTQIQSKKIEYQQNVFIADTLAEARAQIPKNYIGWGRMEGDDPAIVEVWVRIE